MVEDVTELCGIREKIFGNSEIVEREGSLENILKPRVEDFYRVKVRVEGTTYAHRIYIKLPTPGLYSFVVLVGVGDQVDEDQSRWFKGPYCAPHEWPSVPLAQHPWGADVGQWEIKF